jgi:hypothetical protein
VCWQKNSVSLESRPSSVSTCARAGKIPVGFFCFSEKRAGGSHLGQVRPTRVEAELQRNDAHRLERRDHAPLHLRVLEEGHEHDPRRVHLRVVPERRQ